MIKWWKVSLLTTALLLITTTIPAAICLPVSMMTTTKITTIVILAGHITEAAVSASVRTMIGLFGIQQENVVSKYATYARNGFHRGGMHRDEKIAHTITTMSSLQSSPNSWTSTRQQQTLVNKSMPSALAVIHKYENAVWQQHQLACR
jgi:hypothetical protein